MNRDLPRHTRCFVALAACGVVMGCVPAIELPAGAHVVCDNDDACPSGTVCLEGYRVCADASTPCLDAAGAPANDGARCDDGVCARGLCIAATCGDGFLDPEREQCEAALDPRCRADCTMPSCGDGIVDVDETCDDATGLCVSCVQQCDATFGENGLPALKANCDLALDNRCECESEVIVAQEDSLIAATTIMPDAAYVAVYDNTTNFSATVYRFDAAAAAEAPQVIVEDAGLVSLFSRGDEVFLSTSGADNQSDLFRVQGDQLVPVRTNLWIYPLSGVFLDDDDRLFIAGNEEIWLAHLGDDDDQVEFSRDCDFTDLVSCGGSLLCTHYETQRVVLLDPDTADAETVAGYRTETSPPSLACIDGTPMWNDLGTIFALGADHVPFPLFSPIVGNSAVNLGSGLLDLGNGRALVAEFLDASGVFTYAFDLAGGRLTVLTTGAPIARIGDEVLTFRFELGALVRTHIPGLD